MRPHSSRPLQYEDGVGGSQRGAPSSGTNTGNRRAGKRRHGKRLPETPEKSRGSRPSCGQRVGWGGGGAETLRIEPTPVRGATAVVSETLSGEKHGGSWSFGGDF